jgi:AraC-like DNA-binding protein/uncharacterized cupin superfamily protein
LGNSSYLSLEDSFLHYEDIGGLTLHIEACREAESFLNEYVRQLAGDDLFFKIYYWGVNPRHYDNPFHKHSFFEICYVMDGQGTYSEHDSNYPLQAGTLFLSRPGMTHQIRSRSGLFLIYIAFEAREDKSSASAYEIYQQLYDTGRFYIEDASSISAAPLWKALLLEAANRRQPFQKEVTAGLARGLLLSFLSIFADRQEHRKIISPSTASTLLYRAKLYIRDNLSDPIKLQDVARYLHISGRHLSRLFAAELGGTFTHYLRSERLQAAAGLLENTDLSIKQVAEMTGFGSVHYFTRIFSVEMKKTPGSYRQAVMRTR